MILAALAAFAQDTGTLNAESFQLSSDARRTVAVDEASITAGWTASVSLNYQRAPVIFELGGEPARLVRDALALDLAGSLSFSRVRFGLTAPAYLVVTSDVDRTRTVLGDPGLHLKVALFEPDAHSPWNLALVGSLQLPLGGSRYYLGANAASGRIGLAADGSRGILYLVGNAGAHLQKPQEAENVRLGHGLYARAAIGVQPIERLAIALEAFGRYNLARDSEYDNNLELMLGIHRTGPGISPWGAIGAAVTPAVGSPIVRGMLGVRVAPRTPGR